VSGTIVTAGSLGELYDRSVELLARGSRRAPAANGPAGVRSVLECMTYCGVLRDPRHRLLRGDGRCYAPGQAAARFLYFLSGSDRREQIEFYTGSVEAFSPDGVALGGSAHGVRLFHRVLGRSLFDHALSCLEADGESNRALIPFYWPEDVGAGHKDAPCLLGVLPYRRGGRLFLSVQMRAQELSRLLAYDVFELTMLQELLASALSLELGSYTHGAFALQLVERGADSHGAGGQLARNPENAPPMARMPPVTESTRRDLVRWEERVRAAILAGQGLSCLRVLQREAPPYWFDLLAAAAAHAMSRRPGAEEPARLEELASGRDSLLALEVESIATWQRLGRERAHANL
jgi:hypothetical protein